MLFTWNIYEKSFTPYFALTEHDRSRLSYLAEIDLPEGDARLAPVGLFDPLPERLVLEVSELGPLPGEDVRIGRGEQGHAAYDAVSLGHGNPGSPSGRFVSNGL